MNYLLHIADESARFAAALRHADPDGRVPSCPDWDPSDLIWHLAEVQWLWAAIVDERVDDPKRLIAVRPERPADVSELRALGERCSSTLSSVLAAAAPEVSVWTWATDQTVGFVRRRQAHEAFIHRVDAELVTGARSPMDLQLSADGVDEVLRIMYGDNPGWATVTPEPGATVRVVATDTGHHWLTTLGRVVGTSPDGTSHDEGAVVVAAQDSRDRVRATVSGTAADLDCWFWHRPTSGSIERVGDATVLTALDAVLAENID